MKIQGIEILRISDFRRFFNMEEFLVNSKRYLKMFTYMNANFFCDTLNEELLVGILRAWLAGMDMMNTITEGQMRIGSNQWVPMKGIDSILREFRETISSKDRSGLAALFLLLSDVMEPEDIREACRIFISFKSGLPMGNIRQVHQDTDFPQGEYKSQGVSPIYVANALIETGVWVSCGSRRVFLEKGDCVIGLFNDKGECFRLLPNESRSDDGKVRMKLKYEASEKRPYLSIKGPDGKRCIDQVSSFWVEPGDYIVYVKQDGTFVFDDRCLALRSSYRKSRDAHPQQQVAAAEQNNGYYSFYYK